MHDGTWVNDGRVPAWPPRTPGTVRHSSPATRTECAWPLYAGLQVSGLAGWSVSGLCRPSWSLAIWTLSGLPRPIPCWTPGLWALLESRKSNPSGFQGLDPAELQGSRLVGLQESRLCCVPRSRPCWSPRFVPWNSRCPWPAVLQGSITYSSEEV
jgi:hypothetical protein